MIWWLLMIMMIVNIIVMDGIKNHKNVKDSKQRGSGLPHLHK
jgi:4-hydroxybenzoate polyprenyltransferase